MANQNGYTVFSAQIRIIWMGTEKTVWLFWLAIFETYFSFWIKMILMKVLDKELNLHHLKFQAKILSGSKVRGMTISLNDPVDGT